MAQPSLRTPPTSCRLLPLSLEVNAELLSASAALISVRYYHISNYSCTRHGPFSQNASYLNSPSILFHFSQLRLDFNTFVISGPNTVTASIGFAAGGSLSKVAGAPVSAITQCLTDTFSVTGTPGGNPPVICGTNTGYHSKLSHFKFSLICDIITLE